MIMDDFDDLDFFPYMTPLLDFHIIIDGWFFFLNSDIPICKQKADYIPYTNTTAFISGGKADVPKLRCIYKGCTL